MKIGIDFDNTIAEHEQSFINVAIKKKIINKNWQGSGKKDLKNFIYYKKNGKKKWMEVQGLVYGKYMEHAKLIPNVVNFLKLCKAKKHELFIVSHKTKYGHFDSKKILLRKQAVKWMRKHGFFNQNYIGFNKENIFFADTRKEKIDIISKIKCDWFIDDLREVLIDQNFPLNTKKIFFNKNKQENKIKNIIAYNNWSDISDTILGNLNKNDINILINFFKKKQKKKIQQISGHGNSRIYKMMTEDKKNYAIKYYPDLSLDTRPRLKTEFKTLKFLHQHNITNVPKAVKIMEDFNLGIYEWIEGQSITNPTMNDIYTAANFIKKLNVISRNKQFKKINVASEACLSWVDLINQIEKRLEKFNKLKKENTKLKKFLNKNFTPLWKKVKKKSFNEWPLSSRNKALSLNKLTLSPSDFGFHNAIKKNDQIIFIDFEYFGWDDPVKLAADFVWHPSLILKANLIESWNKLIKKNFSKDKDFAIRLNAAMPLFGMRWIMIILNEFLQEYVQRRKRAARLDPNNKTNKQNVQLNKAIIYCKKVKNYLNKN